mmetsp:Transcript_34719/g.81043  ORF Transcript_34719/g.81043 Transcript_34719/m.81043 type:complete len:632 (+) Transcript_34719:79-1974(+)
MALVHGLLGSLVYVGYVVAQDLSAFRECPEVSSYYNVCCARLREEARQACMEYANWGFTQEDCLPWLEAIDTHCPLVCGDCWELGLRLRQECRFQLQVLNEPATATIWCNETANDFMNNRCRPACEVNETMCASDEARECMRTCGNYNTCTCRKFKGSQQPSFCDGFTFSDGVVNRRDDLFYDCALTPASCKHTDGVTCNTYRYCTPDLCLIDDVDCSPRHQCEAPGRCDSEKGLCFYENQVNGYPCDDNIFYTLNDSCQNGFCEGTADFCLGYNVSCEPLSSCLSGGECHPSTGRCTYEKLPDETPCDDGRQFTVQDMCQNGLCVGRPQDLCEQRGVVCEAPNWCYDPGRCDPKTGLCSEPTLAPGYRPCNDQDPTTSNDSCIEGVCMGMLADGYEYQTIGAGECVDRENRRMARYAGDVKDQRECERICTGDPQCAGYAYNFPLCSIYGTVRTTIPMEMPTWSFQAGTDPLGVIIEASQVMTDVQRRSICRRKGVVPDRIVSPSDVEVSADEFFSPVRIGIFFLVLLGCFFALPLTDYISRLLKCRKDPLEEIASQVAQDPAQYDESPHTEKGYSEDQLALEQEEYPGLEGLRDAANADDPVLPNEALPYDDRPEPPPDTPPNPPGTVA